MESDIIEGAIHCVFYRAAQNLLTQFPTSPARRPKPAAPPKGRPRDIR